MKIKQKKILANIPVIMSFRDYHEISYVLSYLNELVGEKSKLKAKELPAYGSEYSAIFYFKQDDEFRALVKEHKKLNEEVFD